MIGCPNCLMSTIGDCGMHPKKPELEMISATFTMAKYPFPINDFIEYVFKAKSEDNAVWNIKAILKEYKNSLSAWELIKLLFKK